MTAPYTRKERHTFYGSVVSALPFCAMLYFYYGNGALAILEDRKQL